MATSRRKARVVTAALVRQGEDEEAFNREFWEGVGERARVEALWDMLLEYYAARGHDGHEPRLQRSVLRVRRLRRTVPRGRRVRRQPLHGAPVHEGPRRLDRSRS